MEYQLIRSRRKTMSIEISREAQVIVRAPLRLPLREIERFLGEKRRWIDLHLERQRQRNAAHPEPDEDTWRNWRIQARSELPERVAHYAQLMGVTPTAVHFSRARTRFGSCSAKKQHHLFPAADGLSPGGPGLCGGPRAGPHPV